MSAGRWSLPAGSTFPMWEPSAFAIDPADLLDDAAPAQLDDAAPEWDAQVGGED